MKIDFRKVLFVCSCALLLFLPFILQPRAMVELRYHNHKYLLEVASTPSSQQKGLGGRSMLADDEGMLFVFDQPGVRCMWMKDMRFPIDIIWLDSTKKVTHVASHVTPQSYPAQYCGDATTKYVIELKAGEARGSGIDVGKILKL